MSVRLEAILEGLVDASRHERDPVQLGEWVRLGNAICRASRRPRRKVRLSGRASATGTQGPAFSNPTSAA